MKKFIFALFMLTAAAVIIASPVISHAISHNNPADKMINIQFAPQKVVFMGSTFAEIVTIDVYEYRPAGRRDPFAPLVVKPEPIKEPLKEPRPLKPRLPLESYDVKEFRLIATLWNKAGYYALIKLPDDKSYTIREGMKLGLHGGKVYKITKDSVIIRENIRDHRGVLVPRDTILKLRPEDKG
jgi:Tfp pilus assembly protein PilP